MLPLFAGGLAMSLRVERTAEEWAELCASQQRTIASLSHTVDTTLERLDQMEYERDQAVKRTPKIAQFIIDKYEGILDSLRLSGSHSPEA